MLLVVVVRGLWSLDALEIDGYRTVNRAVLT